VAVRLPLAAALPLEEVNVMIDLKDITKVYHLGKRELTVLHGINFSIAKGEMVAIMGPSGSGKSTVLNLLGCLDQPTTGNYLLDGEDVSRMNSKELAEVRARKIGFIFQQFNLLPRASALANVELGMRYAGGIDRERAIEALKNVGLADRITHRPNEMSGGEQQRVAIARALVKNPPLLLADEPTGNLDSKSGKEVINILTSLHAGKDVTLVIITHDPHVAEYCQRTIYIRDGQVVKEANA
jgi:putative ABC transport system ATP-binding protein